VCADRRYYTECSQLDLWWLCWASSVNVCMVRIEGWWSEGLGELQGQISILRCLGKTENLEQKTCSSASIMFICLNLVSCNFKHQFWTSLLCSDHVPKMMHKTLAGRKVGFETYTIHTVYTHNIKSSVSHDISEILLICWYAAQETFLITNVDNSCAAVYFCGLFNE